LSSDSRLGFAPDQKIWGILCLKAKAGKDVKQRYEGQADEHESHDPRITQFLL